MTSEEWYGLRERYELVRKLCHIPENIVLDSDFFVNRVESWVAHCDLRREYVRELLRIIGQNPSSDHLWLLVTANSEERCLAAYNVLEGRQ